MYVFLVCCLQDEHSVGFGGGGILCAILLSELVHIQVCMAATICQLHRND